MSIDLAPSRFFPFDLREIVSHENASLSSVASAQRRRHPRFDRAQQDRVQQEKRRFGAQTIKTNITLRVDSSLIRQARILAAKMGTSLSGLMAEQLEQLVRADSEYQSAKQRSLNRLESGFDLGWTPPASRDELYER